MKRLHRPRDGFTMIEMIFAVSITVLVFSIAVPFFRAQTRAMDAGAGRLDAFQSARYAVWRIEADLQMAAGEVGQPVIVQAASFAIAFNANRLGRTAATDPNAMYWDSSYDTLWTQSWMTSRAAALRTSFRNYPTAAYTDANGGTSKAETIQYFLKADTAGGATNLYVLYRKVNDRDSTLVTRDLYVPSDSNFFFRYYRTNASGATSAISKDSVPIYWDDASARDDSITAVEVRATGRYWDARNRTNVYRKLYTLVKLRNAFQTLPINCGSVPSAPASLTATTETAPAGAKLDVRLDWTAVAGDSTAPRDVRDYVIYRKLSAATTWTLIGTKPARGATNYRYQDFDLPVTAGTYVWGVAARDCSGLSAVRQSATSVTFP